MNLPFKNGGHHPDIEQTIDTVLKGVCIQNGKVGPLADRDGADLFIQPKRPSRIDGDGTQGLMQRQAL